VLVLSLRHMDQRELYWTLAECIAWARTRDDEAVKGCADPGLSLEIPDDVLQILEDLRQRCRDGSLRAQGRRWDPLPGALDRVPYDPWSGRPKAQFEPVPSPEWSILNWAIGPRYPRGALSDRSGVLRWVDVAFAKSQVIEQWPASGEPPRTVGSGQQLDKKKPLGRRSQGPRMHAALSELIRAGNEFGSKKAARVAVMNKLGIPEGKQGWSYRTFLDHCSDLLNGSAD